MSCTTPVDPGGPMWTRVATDGVPARWGHVAVYDAKRDRMVVFAGDGLDSETEAENEGATAQRNDLWALDLTTLEWQPLAATNVPGPRTDLAGVMDTTNDRLVVIGGRVGFATSIDEVWAYSFATGAWAELPSGPSARHDVPGATNGSRGWVFGGAGGFLQSLDDLWELDFTTDSWRQMPDDGVRPSARTSGALVYFANALYASGGHDATSVQGDSWRYDLVTERWTKLEPSGGPTAWAHFGYAFDAACSTLWLSAGDNLDNYDLAFTNALVVTGSPSFSVLATSNLPPPRDHPSMILDAARRRLVLYGGGTLGDGLGTLGDGWMLPLGACP
jgi:Galactose oxidase, central domain/Kelch motif